jgi:hypothetical protein
MLMMALVMESFINSTVSVLVRAIKWKNEVDEE